MAAGAGITPVLPLIKTLLYHYPHVRVVLIYSNRSSASTIFFAVLQQLQQLFPDRLMIAFLFSSARDLARARLGKALLETLFNTYRKAATPDILFYTCGPFEYMRMVNITLLQLGASQEQIKKEIFEPLPPPVQLVPPDSDSHTVVIRINKKDHFLLTAYPQTILQAAKKAGILLPYSCEAGRCGSCAALCLQGEVWMSNNEVLMDDETKRGKVLTCTGYAVNGDVLISYE